MKQPFCCEVHAMNRECAVFFIGTLPKTTKKTEKYNLRDACSRETPHLKSAKNEVWRQGCSSNNELAVVSFVLNRSNKNHLWAWSWARGHSRITFWLVQSRKQRR